MTEAGKGAEEVQDILLKNVAMFQKVCDRIQFEGVSRSEFWKRIGQGHKVNTGNARFFQAFFLFNNKKESGLFPDSFFG